MSCKIIVLLGNILLAISLIFAIDGVHSVERGTIIPLYVYPRLEDGSDAWKPLKDAFTKYPIETWAIVNVNSGPGSSIDENYATAIASLKSMGIKTLGYVSTAYTNRPASVVQTEIGIWKDFYAPDGIFLDEMTNDDVAEHYDYYADLDSYAKSNGFTFTVGNPGTDVPLGYFQSVDTVMIYEKASYPDDATVCNSQYDGVSGEEKEALAIFPYNIPTVNETDILYAKNCVGYIYITNDSGVNPWDALPPYLEQLFEILSR